MGSTRIFIFIILLLSVMACAPTHAQGIKMKKKDGGFLFVENGRAIMFFQKEMNDSIPEFARNNYFHPVYDLKGKILTEDFPDDHPHQRGIFWAWHQLLHNDSLIADQWILKNFGQDIRDLEFISMKNGAGQFTYTSLWHQAESSNTAFIREETKVLIYPSEKKYRRIDFEISLLALKDNIKLGGSDDLKGYGGFSVRMKTDEHTIFTDFDGKVIIPQETGINAGKAVDITNPKDKNGILLIDWEQNPESFWILRQDNSMQNIVWPGRKPVRISTEKAQTLKYTLFIHSGKRKKIKLDEKINSF